MPLEMQDFEPRHCHYHYERHNSTHPAYPLRMSTRDLARFGLLHLREGRWRDTQLIPSAWVRESTRSYSETPSGGYGYMWWTEHGPLGELGTYAAAGWGGHRMYVIPRAQLVIVHRADTYLNGEVANHEMGGLIEKILRARIGPPASQPRLMDMPDPRRVDEALVLTKAETASLCGEYMHGRTRMVVRQSGDRIELQIPNGRFFLHRGSSSEFAVEDMPHKVEFHLDDSGKAIRLRIWRPLDLSRSPSTAN